MKKLADLISLSGEVETISITEFRAQPGECLDQVVLGKSFCVTRQGRIVAFLVPPADADVVHVISSDGSCPTLGLPAAEPKGRVICAICERCWGKHECSSCAALTCLGCGEVSSPPRPGKRWRCGRCARWKNGPKGEPAHLDMECDRPAEG